MRIVLDTNVLISAFVFPGGPPESVYRLALEGRAVLITSPPILAEFGRILVDKFGWDAPMAEEAVALVARVSTIIRPSMQLAEVDADPDDDRILEAALEGQADMIVSGDKHLLRIGTWRDIPVVKPADFLATL